MKDQPKFDGAPQYILANKRQLEDVQRFTTNPIKFSYVGMDPTFRMGRFYVTPLVYKNMTLVKRRDGKHPYFIGPAFVHQSRNTEDYRHFLSQLKVMRPGLELIQAIGMDDELALSNVVVAELPDAIRLKCKIHKRDNVKHKLRAFRINSDAENEIIKDIFGEVREGIRYRGLYHASNVESSDNQLRNVQAKWEEHAPGFHGWFEREQADTFKTSIIESVRKAAQIDDDFTMNPSESLNEQLKAWVSRERSSMAEFNKKFEDLREAQEAEAEKAIYGVGEYDLAINFKHLEIQPRVWKQMPPQRRAKHIERFWSTTMTDAQNFQNLVDGVLDAAPRTAECHENLEMVQSTTPNECPTHGGVSPPDAIAISIPACELSHPSIPGTVLQAIWNKADELIKTDGKIENCPGNPKARMVESRRGDRPHLVKEMAGGKITCDCPNYSSLQVYAHAIAAAEKMGCLRKFVDW